MAARVFSILGLVLSLLVHVLDQATDAFAAVLFYAEGRTLPAILTLFFLFAPGLYIFIYELKKFCSGKSNVVKALAYLLLSPLWAIIVHLYSLFDARYVRTALFFKTLEAFLEAGPQLVLQMSLLFRGYWTSSSKMALDPILDKASIQVVEAPEVTNVTTKNIEMLGRVYDETDRVYFGWVHLLSVLVSFVSIFMTSITFNDVEAQARAKGNLPKLCVAVPYFFSTLLFRSVSLVLLICLVRYWAAVLVFSLFFLNVLTALYIGDDFLRSCSYGLWSVLVPVGYNRDPASPLGYTKVPLFTHELETSQQLEPVSDKDIERSHGRARYFLTAHTLSSVLILGLTVVLAMILMQTPVLPEPRLAFDVQLLNTVFLPVLVLSLGFSVLLVRPYHRCECTGGEGPAGNVIV